MSPVPGGSSAPAPAPTAGKTYDILLDLAPIQGEGPNNTIEIDTVALGGSNTPIRTVASGGATKGGKPTITEITIQKSVDKSSTALWSAVANGQKIKTGTITFNKSTGGKKPETYMTITLTNVYVTGVQFSSGHGSVLGTESVTLNFENINWEYKAQGIDGLLTTAGQFIYDLLLGKTG